jgi:hypothetical protein
MSTSPMGANKPIEDIEGNPACHARGRTWGQSIFQDLLKKEP